MAVIEQDVVFTTKDANGNTVIQMPITRAENIENVMSIEQGGTGATTVAAARNALGLGNTSGAVPIANGGTGATTVADARTNLGLSTAITGASISGKTITLTKADGTTQKLTTQDTVKKFYEVTKSTSFTASYDCIAVFYHKGAENYQYVTINGTQYNDESHHQSSKITCIPLKVGDVVSCTNFEKVWVMEVR